MIPGRTHPSRNAARIRRARATRKAIPTPKHERAVMSGPLFYMS
jgi:hypothetical protein